MKFSFVNPRRKMERGNIWSTVNSVTIPLGLATLAAVLERAGHEAQVIDAEALALSHEETAAMIAPDAAYVGFTATTPEMNTIIALAGLTRKRLPKAKIVFGGVHPTVFSEALVASGACDMAVHGEGENAVVALAEGKPPGNVPNLTWKNASGAVINNPSGPYVDLENLPYPAYHLLPMERYHAALGAAKQSPQMGMITSRGCPGKCTFCFSGMFGERIRMIPAPKVFEHIRFLRERYGVREISFYDDTFTANRKRVEELCGLLMESKLKISWSCFARVDSVRPETLKLMAQAGCHQIMYGLESPDEEILKNINKKTTTIRADEAMRWARQAGIGIRGALMLGNPGETPETMRKTIEYSKAAPLQFAIFNITTPFPGTAMFEWAKERGVLKHEDWDRYDLSHAVMELPGASAEEVEAAYKRAYREFYFRPSYALRRALSIRTPYEFRVHAMAFAGILATALKKKPPA